MTNVSSSAVVFIQEYISVEKSSSCTVYSFYFTLAERLDCARHFVVFLYETGWKMLCQELRMLKSANPLKAIPINPLLGSWLRLWAARETMPRTLQEYSRNIPGRERRDATGQQATRESARKIPRIFLSISRYISYEGSSDRQVVSSRRPRLVVQGSIHSQYRVLENNADARFQMRSRCDSLCDGMYSCFPEFVVAILSLRVVRRELCFCPSLLLVVLLTVLQEHWEKQRGKAFVSWARFLGASHCQVTGLYHGDVT